MVLALLIDGAYGAAMRSHTLVNATEIDGWSSYRAAQEELPRLIRRLVHATAKGVRKAGFRAGEGVQLSGWDGIVLVDEGNAFLPAGPSAWEMGTGKEPSEKAGEDYRNRLQDPRGLSPAESAFVFVTPRRWSGRDAWERERQAEGRWRTVRALDADSLEEWLDLAPAVHTWLSILIGKRPEDVVDLDSFWSDWSEVTRPTVSPHLVLSGRNEVVKSIYGWLEGPSELLALAAESRDEATAIFAAALHHLPEDLKEKHLSQSIVVFSLPAWHRVTASANPLILVPRFDVGDAVARATRMNHRVLIPLGASDTSFANTVFTPRLSTEEAARALVESGVPEDSARSLATLARRSMMSFRRRLAVSPEVQQPIWARPEQARELLPAMLAGAWTETREGDCEVVAGLAARPYEQVVETLSRWQFAADAPVRHIGGTWFIASKEDAWQLLARYLARHDFERFEAQVVNVFGGPDPRFDLPDDQRWMADALGHRHRYSERLREGVAETLAIMGARGETVGAANAGSAREYARRIVRGLFDRANTDWRIWASLPLRLLAEAAPDAFLTALEAAASGKEPVVLNLFTDQVHALFSSSPHTELLWALEVLAWTPGYLGRVALLLAKLTTLDPGGKLSNRPENSLCQAFLLWHPQTVASLEQRLRVLDVLREREPEVAWRLLRQLIPSRHEIAHNTAKPRFRDWVPEALPQVTRREVLRGIREIVDRMLQDVGQTGRRWCDLIGALQNLPEDKQNQILERLVQQSDRVSRDDQEMIWNALRELISAHRSFWDAQWAMPPERADRLETILHQFEPRDLNAKYGWLFSDRPQLLEGLEQEFDRHREVVAASRLDAIRAIHSAGGLRQLLTLAGEVQRPLDLGWSVGQSDLFDEANDEILGAHLASEDRGQREFARGFVYGRVARHGRGWAEARLGDVEMTDAQRAEVLSCLPTDGQTWDMAQAAGAEVEKLYWHQAHPWGIQEAPAVERAARKFLQHGRPFTAIGLLANRAMQGQTVPSRLSVEVLQQALRISPGDDRPMQSFSFQLSRLLDALEASGEVGAETIALLEWGFLPFLGKYPRDRHPRLLQQKLGRDPEFFVEILSMAYRADGEEPRELSELERARSDRAHDLLHDWRELPGSADDGTVDSEKLKAWVRQARERCARGGRAHIGDHVIGHMLRGSPPGPDGVWPHPAVRELIEEAMSPELEDGIAVAVYNARGMVSKNPFEGGGQERTLVSRYDGFAKNLADRYPRTSAILQRLADGYRAEARQEDQEAELREDLGV